jgi:hypothetical protein
VGTSYGFSRHTKVVDIAASKVLFGLLKSVQVSMTIIQQRTLEDSELWVEVKELPLAECPCYRYLLFALC